MFESPRVHLEVEESKSRKLAPIEAAKSKIKC